MNSMKRAVLLLSLISAACQPAVVKPAAWNQFHADVSGTGSVFAASKPATGSGVIQAQIGRIVHASPVIGADGRAYVSTYEPSNAAYGKSRLLRLGTTGSLAIQQAFDLTGQATTPAVDAQGNVYVTTFMTTERGSALHSFGALQQQWVIPIVPGRSLTPPRILEAGGRTLILLTYTGGRGGGGRLLIASSGGTKLLDVDTCNVIVGGGHYRFRHLRRRHLVRQWPPTVDPNSAERDIRHRPACDGKPLGSSSWRTHRIHYHLGGFRST
jgi:hypothetical protein